MYASSYAGVQKVAGTGAAETIGNEVEYNARFDYYSCIIHKTK